jgi:hypothetical protein
MGHIVIDKLYPTDHKMNSHCQFETAREAEPFSIGSENNAKYHPWYNMRWPFCTSASPLVFTNHFMNEMQLELKQREWLSVEYRMLQTAQKPENMNLVAWNGMDVLNQCHSSFLTLYFKGLRSKVRH